MVGSVLSNVKLMVGWVRSPTSNKSFKDSSVLLLTEQQYNFLLGDNLPAIPFYGTRSTA